MNVVRNTKKLFQTFSSREPTKSQYIFQCWMRVKITLGNNRLLPTQRQIVSAIGGRVAEAQSLKNVFAASIHRQLILFNLLHT